MKKSLLILALTAVCFSAPYTQKIGLYTLSITAPRSERSGEELFFYASPGTQNVLLRYDNTVIRAGQVRFSTASSRVYLSRGFHSRYLNNEISGEELEYDPASNYMYAQDIAISTEDLYVQSRRLFFRGEKIALTEPVIGVPMYDFGMKSRRLDIYPGWAVFYDTTFNGGPHKLWYIPVYVVDKRRNAFSLPGSFPQWGRTYFAGDFFRWNNHYYVDEKFYGNLQLGYAEEKGAGYGMQNIMRFSDYDQMTYINENWQYWPTQEKLSYEHSFLEVPYAGDKDMTFNELLQYNTEINNAEASILRLTRTVQEESGVDIINKDIELEYYAIFHIPWQQLNLYTTNTYTSVRELTTETSGSRWQSYSELSRDYELPYLMSIRPGIGYDTVKYSLYPYNWHRVFSFVNARRRLWIFNWDARVYDYVDERGRSPFSYDEHYEIGDNVRTTAMVSLWHMRLGQTLRYLIYNGRINRIIYFLEYTSRPWTIRLENNATEESWWAGVSASF
ncbi:MAG: hypothetical protein LBQ83_01955 [Candidatus Margulisbacteria bacterium]|jgi:hypothetical protein|nr:hypothetical protein [Candidatus Margulisiibacteriota bacterium]